jgi:hypothetical protein
MGLIPLGERSFDPYHRRMSAQYFAVSLTIELAVNDEREQRSSDHRGREPGDQPVMLSLWPAERLEAADENGVCELRFVDC